MEKHLHNQKATQTNDSSKEADGLDDMERGCPPSPEKLRICVQSQPDFHSETVSKEKSRGGRGIIRIKIMISRS